MCHFLPIAYISCLHMFLDCFYKEERNLFIYFYRMSNLKPTDKAADLAVEVIYLLKGLIKHTEVNILIPVSFLLEFTGIRLSFVSNVAPPVHSNSIAMIPSTELLS